MEARKKPNRSANTKCARIEHSLLYRHRIILTNCQVAIVAWSLAIFLAQPAQFAEFSHKSAHARPRGVNFSQLMNARWLRRLTDLIQRHRTSLKYHHRLGPLPETA
jgi:hypothetical protein